MIDFLLIPLKVLMILNLEDFEHSGDTEEFEYSKNIEGTEDLEAPNHTVNLNSFKDPKH